MFKWINSIASTSMLGCLAMGLAACATTADKQATIAQANATATEEDASEDKSGLSILELASPATPAQIRAAARDASDPVVCKTENVSGSRLAKIKVCARESERETARSRTKIGLDELHRRSASGGLRAGGL